MKQIVALWCVLFMAGYTQAQPVSDHSALLNSYYQLKNLLVEGNAGKASAQAKELAQMAGKLDPSKLSSADQKVFLSLKDKIRDDAQAIASANALEKQRDLFSALSNNMIALAKAVKLSVQPVYVDYCPMKKMYWLSEDKSIRNPYYGNAMLACGSIKETIQ